MHTERLLRRAADLATEYLHTLPDRPVGRPVDRDELRARLGHPLLDAGVDPLTVIEELAADADPGLVASAGPRYFGFVIGGALPASVAADWLACAWDQNAALYLASPAASVVEEVAGEWLKELLGIPEGASVGLTTGAGLANAVGLAAGRHAVLGRAGWDVEARGLFGAPEVHVVVGDEVHATLLAALQYLGLGRERVRRVPTDGNGAMRADLLPAVLQACDGPTLVAAQAGNVNTGACDPLEPIADAVAVHSNAWLHIDGAFGLWAAASPRLEHLVTGSERADSWSTDAHKWLNVGYDCGVVAVADPDAHAAAMSTAAAYLVAGAGSDPMNRVLDFSRRARGFAVYASIRSLGKAGVCDLVERCCSLARRMAERLSAANGVEILNEVVLNQVLVRFHDPRGSGDDDAWTDQVIGRVQAEGTCWVGGTTWRGQRAMRISVSNWSTTEADIDRSVDAILAAHLARKATSS